MGFKDFGSETLLSSDVDNLLMKQANIRCLAGSEPTGEEGMEVHQTDKDRVAIFNGSAYVRTGWWSSAGRTGCRLTRASNQNIPNSGDTAILWDTEASDSDNFYPGSGGTITIPAGLGGLYLATCDTNWDSGVGSAVGGYLKFVHNASEWTVPIPADFSTIAATIGPLAYSPGDTLVVSVAQSSGGTRQLTATLEFWRIGA